MNRNETLFGVPDPLALVTGSVSPRVGYEISMFLHQRGFRVILHGRQQFETWTAPEFAEYVVWGDVADTSIPKKWLQEIVQRFGRVDCLVNCASIWDPKKLEETSVEDFEANFRVNALAPALLCQTFGLQMTKQETGGAIVNIGDWAVQRPYQDFSAYFLSKGAISTLTETMAIELAARNSRVRVSAVLPGPVLLSEDLPQDRAREITEQSLLKRAGTAQDVAEAVHFLITSPFVTGVSLPVDGGRTIHAGHTRDVSHPQAR